MKKVAAGPGLPCYDFSKGSPGNNRWVEWAHSIIFFQEKEIQELKKKIEELQEKD